MKFLKRLVGRHTNVLDREERRKEKKNPPKHTHTRTHNVTPWIVVAPFFVGLYLHPSPKRSLGKKGPRRSAKKRDIEKKKKQNKPHTHTHGLCQT